jgi:hypothetical protein
MKPDWRSLPAASAASFCNFSEEPAPIPSQTRGAEQLGQSTTVLATGQVHLEQPVLGVDPTLQVL